jgi:hypothetical protein
MPTHTCGDALAGRPRARRLHLAAAKRDRRVANGLQAGKLIHAPQSPCWLNTISPTGSSSVTHSMQRAPHCPLGIARGSQLRLPHRVARAVGDPPAPVVASRSAKPDASARAGGEPMCSKPARATLVHPSDRPRGGAGSSTRCRRGDRHDRGRRSRGTRSRLPSMSAPCVTETTDA